MGAIKYQNAIIVISLLTLYFSFFQRGTMLINHVFVMQD